MFKVKIEIEDFVSEEQMGDIYEAACYGGCNYWASEAEMVHNDDGTINSFRFVDMEEDGANYIFTPQKFANAMAQHASSKGWTIEELIDNHDALDADSIVQIAIFGEERYG